MANKLKILFTLIFAGIICIALSFVLPKNSEKYLQRIFWTKKTFAPNSYDIVLMGDSRVYRGVDPEIIEEELPNLRVLNFGFSNGGLNPIMFKAAEQKLNPYSKHKVIVLGVSANTLTAYTQPNKQFSQELLRPKEEILESLYLTPVAYWFSTLSPEKLIEKFKTRKAKPTSWYISNYKMNGYVESDKFPTDSTFAIPFFTKDFNKFKVDVNFENQLAQQIKEWTKKEILVIGFRPPTSYPMQILSDTLGEYNYERIKQKFIKSGGFWIDFESGGFKTYDGSHLDKNSSNKLSLEIAKEIEKLLQKNALLIN